MVAVFYLLNIWHLRSPAQPGQERIRLRIVSTVKGNGNTKVDFAVF